MQFIFLHYLFDQIDIEKAANEYNGSLLSAFIYHGRLAVCCGHWKVLLKKTRTCC